MPFAPVLAIDTIPGESGPKHFTGLGHDPHWAPGFPSVEGLVGGSGEVRKKHLYFPEYLAAAMPPGIFAFLY